jgi:hypothetical protein
MSATTIDEVLSQLEKIINDSQRTGDRVGYFAALYYKVTSGVKTGIAKNEFEDGPRMARLDVIFANRYLDALEQWKNGQPLSASWKVALDATRQSSLLVLQHLLLGMNAHINLDLGIAAVEVMQGQPIEGIQKDFDAINTIIGSLTNEVIREIDRVSPLLSLLGLHADRTDLLLIQFSIGNARDGAWSFAQDLSKTAAGIAARDKSIAQLASTISQPRGVIRFTLWFIHLFEWKRPGKIIHALNSYTKTFITTPGAKAATHFPTHR